MSWASSKADSSGSSSSAYSASSSVVSALGGRRDAVSITAVQRRDELKKRESVMSVFCKTREYFETGEQYEEYRERAEDIVFRLVSNKDTETARQEIERERALVGDEVIQKEAERRRNEADKRRQARLREPTWGLGLPSKRKALEKGTSEHRRAKLQRGVLFPASYF